MSIRTACVAVMGLVSVMTSGCASEDPYAGHWEGSCDMSDELSDMELFIDEAFKVKPDPYTPRDVPRPRVQKGVATIWGQMGHRNIDFKGEQLEDSLKFHLGEVNVTLVRQGPDLVGECRVNINLFAVVVNVITMSDVADMGHPDSGWMEFSRAHR